MLKSSCSSALCPPSDALFQIATSRLDRPHPLPHLPEVIESLFFDAAGTLIEPAEPVAMTYARLLSPHLGPLDPVRIGASFGLAFQNAGIPNYPDFPDGDTAERAWWREVVELSIGSEVSDEAFHELFDHYARAEAWRVFPEVRQILAESAALGLKCVVVSNFDLRLHRILEALELSSFFEQIITSADAAARKPSPLIFKAALEALNLSSDKVLHVGDSESADMKGAKAAGIEAFLLKRPKSDLTHFMEMVARRKGI
jgi:putative hydrolase of the HAD superfamily